MNGAMSQVSREHRAARQKTYTLKSQEKKGLICVSHPGVDNTSIMLPVVERGLSWT